MNYGYSEEQDKKEYEQMKEQIKKIQGKDAERYIKGMENFRDLVKKNKREINKKYQNMTLKERQEKIKQQPEVMKERIKILNQYPYINNYFEEFKKYLTNMHGYIPLCEMVISDEFKVFTIQTQKKQPIVVISGLSNTSRDSIYHHIKALCVMPKNHKLTLNEFIKVENGTKATEVKVINEDQMITYQTYTKNINTTGRRSGYSLAISRI